jgi:hypothetical protein
MIIQEVKGRVEQDRHCTYSVTWRHAHATIVAVEKQ